MGGETDTSQFSPTRNDGKRADTRLSLTGLECVQVAQAMGNRHTKECMGNFHLSPKCTENAIK